MDELKDRANVEDSKSDGQRLQSISMLCQIFKNLHKFMSIYFLFFSVRFIQKKEESQEPQAKVEATDINPKCFSTLVTASFCFAFLFNQYTVLFEMIA